MDGPRRAVVGGVAVTLAAPPIAATGGDALAIPSSGSVLIGDRLLIQGIAPARR